MTVPIDQILGNPLDNGSKPYRETMNNGLKTEMYEQSKKCLIPLKYYERDFEITSSHFA